VQATDGNFYGTTYSGGTTDAGTVFKITPQGALTTLHSFDYTDGTGPSGGLVQATDGNFYGTTSEGGATNYNWGTVFSLSVAPAPPVQFVPVTPCRLLDTRPQYDGGGPVQGGTFQNFNLPQLAQSKGCADLSTAAAYSLNVAVVPSGYLGYLTLWPTGQGQPVVAMLNSLDGRIKANAAIVQAGTEGAVSVYVTNTTNVVIDIDGYFVTPSDSTLAFYPITPCRIADTRPSSGFVQPFGPPHLSGGTPRDFPILTSPCNIPNTAQAYSLNLAAIPYPPGSGNPLAYLEVWPKDQMPQNPVSTLNNLTGTIVANAAIVPAGMDGDITVYPSNDTDLVIDINGYFALAGEGGLSLYPVTPCRVIDTRKVGHGQPFSGLYPVDVMDSPCGPPSTAQAYVFNATVVPSGALGYLTLWADGEPQPGVSTLNAIDGWISNNMAIVPTNNGEIDAYASGTTQLILDISSYFAP
ncbi:MAG: choice-of-anchor tandem repeat GloVer-containing protein, partial [Candidatus Korobacteraceae bacterium]